MTATRMKLVLCFLFGLCSAVTAQRELEVRFEPQGGDNYAHAGLVRVYIGGDWGTICASDWDMNDAEVVCKEMGKGYANTITVTGDLPSGSGPRCLSSVRCYGHESLLSECDFTPTTRSSTSNDKGIVCYPPPSEAGMRLDYGPDQYAGWVQVKLASGSWGWLHYYPWSASYWASRLRPSSICRQLGFGELSWWEVYKTDSTTSMTNVYSCAYGIADPRTCTYDSVSYPYQAFLGCHKPGAINCSAPYVPHHATVQDLRLNYNFGDRVNVTCDASNDFFILQCHNKGLWSGPDVSCPVAAAAAAAVTSRHAYCSAPAVPYDSTVQNLRLSYKDGDPVNVTCNDDTSLWFPLTCYDGIWYGQNVVCPDPVIECNPPIIPAVSSVENLKPRYKIGDEVNITCNTGPEWFIWECQDDGMWRGRAVNCPLSETLRGRTPAGRTGNVNAAEKPAGRDFLITGLLVAAVIMFVLVLMSMVAFSISIKGHSSGSSKDGLQDMKADRGPLPDVPEGYADYLVGDKSLYTEPYLKPNDLSHGYETYEKPV